MFSIKKTDVPLDPTLGSALRTLGTERDGIAVLMDALHGKLGEAFTIAVEVIASAKGRVIVTGMGKSGHIGRKIAATLASTGTPAYYVHPGEASHGDLGMIQADDVIVALSWSGETAELADIVAYARRFRVALIAITSNPGSRLAREADASLTLPKALEACPNGVAPTTSTTMQLVIGDALAIALLERRGFTAEHFRLFHPGGKLGAQLKKVRDVMHTGERLPILPLGTSMSEAILVQSEKGFGCVIIAGQDGTMAGIITDGDLRRHMGDNLLSRVVDDVMTRTPLTVPPDMLLGKALEIVETTNKGALVVVDREKPVGLVHVLDLLRAGVA